MKLINTDGLPLIGFGSSRDVYSMGDGCVVKVADGTAGLDQNRVEFVIYNNFPGDKSLLCPVYGISEDGSQLLMAEAKEAFNASPDATEFLRCLFAATNAHEDVGGSGSRRLLKTLMCADKSTIARLKTPIGRTLAKFVKIMLEDFDYCEGELTCVTAWGILEGRYVMIDYGCNMTVFHDHYAEGNNSSENEDCYEDDIDEDEETLNVG